MDALAARPVLATGLVCFSAGLLLHPVLANLLLPADPRLMPAPDPNAASSPSSSSSALQALPYPPDALPGARDIPTPYGNIHLFDLGPRAGTPVLLLPGLSTPCLSLSALALRLATRHGCRVLLLDYFGRGWSDAPGGVDHDERLCISQILCALAGLGDSDSDSDSDPPFPRSFHVLGYSYGGGLAVSLARYFPGLVRSVAAVAPGGLLRRDDRGWGARLLYSRGLLPEALLRALVRRQFEPVAQRAEKGFAGFDAVEAAPGITVGQLVAWQLRSHAGFVPSLMSAYRYGPVYERYEEWRAWGRVLARRRERGEEGVVGRLLLVLGREDPIIRADQIVPEAKALLGEDGVKVALLDAGHELGISKGAEVADVLVKFWEEEEEEGEESSEGTRH